MSRRADPLGVLGAVERAGLPRCRPRFVEPMLATLTEEHFSDPDWLYERKLDDAASACGAWTPLLCRLASTDRSPGTSRRSPTPSPSSASTSCSTANSSAHDHRPRRRPRLDARHTSSGVEGAVLKHLAHAYRPGGGRPW
jgi:hypothetical protein